MLNKIIVDMLTDKSVSIKVTNLVLMDGVEYEVGLPTRKAYVNSEQGRCLINKEIPEPQKSAILLVWGSFPIVDETEIK